MDAGAAEADDARTPTQQPESPEARGEAHDEGRGDIWQSLESMAREDSEHGSEHSFDAEDTGFASHPPDDFTIDVPWERPDQFGLLRGLLETIKRTMLHPADFFRHMPVGGGFVRPLCFYLVLALFQTLVQWMWQSLGMTPVALLPGTETAPQAAPSESWDLTVLAVTPLLLCAALFVVAGLNHLMLMAVRAASRDFEATFRGAAYGVAPMVLAVIPYAGDIVGAVWSMVVTIIAYKQLHRTNYLRVVLAFLLPLALLMTIVLAVSVLSPQAPA